MGEERSVTDRLDRAFSMTYRDRLEFILEKRAEYIMNNLKKNLDGYLLSELITGNNLKEGKDE